ncbi:TetR/AcrR family transcriptional regulator C-terminal domain-containing protein [Kitasatospora kifunensis]|uniref:TetR/AcrR family tetracycline transcriptional repressor n=1 Tax=Kitasatospora kifunensis TaxID=58351 RepID=A0A7W7QZR3_KITKI|nr:TetR/AcrR family transcriptional regulator C-terminal domain-containing protein [Kitasatospora kifunensis]MBB4922504.1 TetR/AcrR family tetracycline transcriptional repressor [Kitasatospora kifunensis]
MALHREDVIEAALDLLDEVGLDRLTTRALTTRLGVAPGALYWHVRSKAELLSAIADRIMREAYSSSDVAPGAAPDVASGAADPASWRTADWAEQTAAFAHRTRRAMLARRDGARVVAGHLPVTVAALDASEQGLALLRGIGLPLAQAAYFGHTVASYVTGFVLQEQAAPNPPAEFPDIEPERYPNMAAWAAEKPTAKDQAFTAGLSLIIQGLRAELAEQA